jgi:glycerol uptake facilitator-like aquaporin
MLLMVVVVGAGIGGNIPPLSSAIAVSGALIGLILVLGSVSGGHFNPIITVAQWRAGQRDTRCTAWYVTAQICGGIVGSLLADMMFAVTPGRPSLDLPNVSSVWSEGMATFGLMVVVFCGSRSTSKLTGPFAVGLWLMGAIIATPTGSIANPAVAVGLLMSPSGASLLATAAFIIAQFVGGALAALCADVLYPIGRS